MRDALTVLLVVAGAFAVVVGAIVVWIVIASARISLARARHDSKHGGYLPTSRSELDRMALEARERRR